MNSNFLCPRTSSSKATSGEVAISLLTGPCSEAAAAGDVSEVHVQSNPPPKKMQLMGREWPCPHLLRHRWRPAERWDPPGAAVAPPGRCQGASGAALLVTGAISQIRQSRAGSNAPKAVITKAKGRSWSRLRNGKCSSCSSHYLSKRAGGDGDEFGDPTREVRAVWGCRALPPSPCHGDQ